MGFEMPTQSVENYLKTIYNLQGEEFSEDRRVQTKEIASHLDISLPSVTSMIQALSDDELVDYQPYQGVKLSEKGRKQALKVIRNHRLIEVFLVQTLGYSWDEVHEEAEQLEHAVSQKLVSRIDSFLSEPRIDPHGDPIPTEEGEIKHPNWIPLSDVEEEESVRIERVLDQQPELLRYLDEHGLTLDTTVSVERVLPFDGQMHLEVDGNEVAISRVIASKLLVSSPD
jgi:DtxR family Mn-dependent transcriptional regulator